MGTETVAIIKDLCVEIEELVKLNNPLMGTETFHSQNLQF